MTTAPDAPNGSPIRELRWVAPGELKRNPRNPRFHPEDQQQALAELIDRLGWVAPLIWNERTGHLLDGHARLDHAEATGTPAVPIVVVDLPADDEALFLDGYDAVGGLAQTDQTILRSLLDDVPAAGDALTALFASMAEAEPTIWDPITEPTSSGWNPGSFEDGRDADLAQFGDSGPDLIEAMCPSCGETFFVDRNR